MAARWAWRWRWVERLWREPAETAIARARGILPPLRAEELVVGAWEWVLERDEGGGGSADSGGGGGEGGGERGAAAVETYRSGMLASRGATEAPRAATAGIARWAEAWVERREAEAGRPETTPPTRTSDGARRIR